MHLTIHTTLDLLNMPANLSTLFTYAVLALSSLCHAKPFSRCTTNADCIRRGLPLLRPKIIPRRSGEVVFDQGYTGSITQLQVPEDGEYKILAVGGSGGAFFNTVYNLHLPAGLAVVFNFTITLQQSRTYFVAVGQAAPDQTYGFNPYSSASGGGGGTFLWEVRDSQSILIAAVGGGGGAGYQTGGSDANVGLNGGVTPPGCNNNYGAGGVNGQGGQSGQPSGQGSGGGGGWFSAGTGIAAQVGSKGDPEGLGLVSTGFIGSLGLTYFHGPGGYGGGGASGTSGGGGGGYSGGGGASGNCNFGGGGGGSYLISTAVALTQAIQAKPGNGHLTVFGPLQVPT